MDVPLPGPTPEPIPPPPPPELCSGCGRPLKPGAAFCSGCGRRRGQASRPPETATDRRRRVERSWQELRFVILLYVMLLGVQAATLIYARVDGDATLGPLIFAIAGHTVFIAAAAWRHRRLVGPGYASSGFRPGGYLLVLLAAPVVLVAIIAYVQGLTSLFGLKDERTLDDFEGNLGLALVLGAAWPALFEEAAFRGVIFGLLRRHVSLREAFIISSFAFAILHLSVPSLVTHLPMGLYFCWLRHRSGSLWPPTVAHFLHNSLVIWAEHLGWIPFGA